MGGLGEFIVNLTQFLSTTVVPFLLGIAFLLFVVNAVRFFILGAGEQETREKAKSLALYSVLAMVFIVAFWGIINILTGGLNLAGVNPPCTDYDPDCNPAITRTTFPVSGQNGTNPLSNITAGNTNPPTLANPPSGATIPPPTASQPILPSTPPSLIIPAAPESSAYTRMRNELLAAATRAEADRLAAIEAQNLRLANNQDATAEIQAVERAASESTVVSAAISAIEQMQGRYDVQTIMLVGGELESLTNPAAGQTERFESAQRLYAMGAITETERNSYILARGADPQTVSQPPLPSDLIERQQVISSTLLREMSDENEGWLIFGSSEEEAAAQASADLNRILNQPAGSERLDSFDTVMLEYGWPMTNQMLVTQRSELLETINAERLLTGQPPIDEDGEIIE
jgi:hypothetical protein